MKALILRPDGDHAVTTARVLIKKGFQVLCVDTLTVAHALIRIDTIDLLVMDERVDGQLTHAIALSAERKNPYISAILLTDRSGADTADLYDLIPALYALVGTGTPADLIGKLAVSSQQNKTAVAKRVAENTAMDQAEAALSDVIADQPVQHADSGAVQTAATSTKAILQVFDDPVTPPARGPVWQTQRMRYASRHPPVAACKMGSDPPARLSA